MARVFYTISLSGGPLAKSESWNTMKKPGNPVVNEDTLPMADFGETAVSSGENGVGKSISTNAAHGSS